MEEKYLKCFKCNSELIYHVLFGVPYCKEHVPNKKDIKNNAITFLSKLYE